MWVLFFVAAFITLAIRETMPFCFTAKIRPLGVATRGRLTFISLQSSSEKFQRPCVHLSSLKRFSSTTENNIEKLGDSNTKKKGIADTPLHLPSANHLLKGLDVYEVSADDGHPLSVYGINSTAIDSSSANGDVAPPSLRPILLLHGRTWSSVPVYHLLGGKNGELEGTSDSRSLMEAFYSAGLQPYCMDFRGFGGTPMDDTFGVLPSRCVKDVECVLDFISSRHATACNDENDTSLLSSATISPSSGLSPLPALLGWSQGALIAQLMAQKRPDMISKLILYGSIYDPTASYKRSPLYSNQTDTDNEATVYKKKKNTFNEAIEDFTVEGSIPPEPAKLFANAALLADPFKAEWKFLNQFNNIDPARVHVPTLVVAGDQDPYAPLRDQAHLFSNLGRGVDRTWSIIADADHAVHLLDGRRRFVNICCSFVENSKKGESEGTPCYI